MLKQDQVVKILSLNEAGSSVTVIADQVGHAEQTIRDYLTLNGRRTPEDRGQRLSQFTALLADYCRRRFADDPHLRASELWNEISELDFRGSRATFYRELTRHRLASPARRRSSSQMDFTRDLAELFRPIGGPEHAPALPRPVAPIAGETLVSYLNRIAAANHLTVTEILAALPSWFSAKINTRNDRGQRPTHGPATAAARHALAHLAGTTVAALAHALRHLDATDSNGPLRATTACRRCAARRGIRQPIPINLPVNDKICTRHRIWLSDADQPHLDIAVCPEIITAHHRVQRLLRHHTPHQFMLAYQAATDGISAWPASPAEIPFHWRFRVLTLQTGNHRHGIPMDPVAYASAAIYPDAVTLAATILNSQRSRAIEQDPMAETRGSPDRLGL